VKEQQLKLGIVGGLGLMSSPMAKHWKPGGPAKTVRVHDRGNPGSRRDACRKAWLEHGAKLVPTLQALVGEGDLDGVFVCCGKNGDDLPIISSITELLSKHPGKARFICHMSTVSVGFAESAYRFCREKGIDYVNYPLTGSAAGAEAATMLILASGELSVFERLAPALSLLGTPKHFGNDVAAGAEVKLMGHLMVFNGLFGISSAAALHTECLNDGKLGGPEQTAFFDFLNSGAGGTRQWEVILRRGISDAVWDAPFSIKYAVVDAIYLAQLCLDKGISTLIVEHVINIALAFSYVLNYIDAEYATHAIVREMVSGRREAFDRFILQHAAPRGDAKLFLDQCIRSLPEGIRNKVALDIDLTSFRQAACCR
jgi:3-hydroxyisobutyrate dehydrogenase